jgi:xanthine dehydrogenase YagS FAD-binding subunit
MQPFRYERATSLEGALAAGAAGARYIAGGSNLFDLMKLGVERPSWIVDIAALPLRGIQETTEGLQIGALTSNTAVANDRRIRWAYPFVSQALLSGANQQLRNAATLAGNLLQRTRCPYFQDVGIAECNKRTAGSGCALRMGLDRVGAVISAPEDCLATMPSDVATPLAALDAQVEIASTQGLRRVTVSELYAPSFATGTRETVLRPGELITAVVLPTNPVATRSVYIKARERTSFAFALVSVAAALKMDDARRVCELRLAVGSIAPAPWRQPTVEAWAIGKEANAETFDALAQRMLASARPGRQNGFKVSVARNLIVRALNSLAEQQA